MRIKEKLYSLAEEEYRAFQAALMPTVDESKILGVRTPILRKIAAELYKSGEYEVFMASLPHEYYEENNLHAFLIENINDFDKAEAALLKFLPYVDNWATCDSMNPKAFCGDREKLYRLIDKLLLSEHTYSIRYGMGLSMRYFLGNNYDHSLALRIAEFESEEYYVRMMQAWFLATALAYDYENAIQILENRICNSFVHRKTIQKAIESYRIRKEKKEYLKTLR